MNNCVPAGRAAMGQHYLLKDLWCGREDSNFHGFYPTATSTLRVYQFRHDRTQKAWGYQMTLAL